MKIRFSCLLGMTAACILMAAPAQARRIAIDQNPDGSRLVLNLGGYCDLDGSDCGTRNLGYSVNFDGANSPITSVGIAGNGLLTFGGAVDFDYAPDPLGTSLRSRIEDANRAGDNPNLALVDYGLNLISAGQNSFIDDIEPANGGKVFYQSARLNIDNGVIRAIWFTCARPPAESDDLCQDKTGQTYNNTNQYSLTLTPTAGGFEGLFDFSKGRGGSDVGYVVNGQQQSVEGNSFFLPATITGLVSAVPEPASWGLMIAGFGLIGGAMRRRPARPQPATV